MSKFFMKKIDVQHNLVYLLQDERPVLVKLQHIINSEIINNISSEDAFILGIKYQEYKDMGNLDE